MKVLVHWMNSMKNQIIKIFQSLKILREMAIRQKTHFKNHLIKNKCSKGSKFIALDATHMWRK